jgi:hypothetical protein
MPMQFARSADRKGWAGLTSKALSEPETEWPLSRMKQAMAETPLPAMPEKKIFTH